jgi:hypothetical protein
MDTEESLPEKIKFRHRAGFGKRMEFYVLGLMLKQGLDIYIPLVDDFGIDAVIRKSDGSFIELQIKARSDEVIFGDAALFAAISHEVRPNYYFVFYSSRIDKTWILSSEEFCHESNLNKNGKNAGKRSIWFNGKNTKAQTEHPHPKFDKYLDPEFKRFMS